MASITINPLPGFRPTDPITIDIINLVKAATGVEISGTVSGIEDGRFVSISILNDEGVSEQFLPARVANGTWSVTLTSEQASALADGSYVIRAFAASTGGAITTATRPLVVDETPPTITAITQDDPATTDAGHVHYTLTFSEAVTVPDVASNFLSLETTGTLAGVRVGGVTEVPGSNGTQYSVDVATGTGEGTIALRVLGQTGPLGEVVTDLAGNGVGPGTIQTTYIATTQPGHDFVAVADLDHDGRADLILANHGTTAAPGNTVSVLLGRGDGSFQPNQDYAVGSGPDSVVIADVNLDGRPDIVAANRASDTVSVLLGNGDGTFQAQHSYATGGTGRFHQARDPELVAALFGNDGGLLSIAVGDVNGDLRPDIVTADAGGTTSVLIGNGNGTFQSAHAFPGGTLGASPSELVLADVNQDGRLDLITGQTFGFSIALGNGDGSFQSRSLWSGLSAASLASADLNRDGNADLILSDFLFTVVGADSPVNRTLAVLLGTGSGTFEPAAVYDITPGGLPSGGPVSIAIVDLDGDHNLDIVTANNTEPSVGVLFGNGDGTFRPQPLSQLPGIIPKVTSVAIGDVDGDGRPDIVADLPGTPLLATLLNRPTQQVGPTYTIDKPDAPIAFASAITTDEDTARAFTAADFAFADPNDNPGDQLAGVIIASLPVHGSLSLDGHPLAANDRVAADRVASLVYTPASDFSGADAFAFQIQDDGGSSGGGHDTSANPATMTISVTAVNDAPVVTLDADRTTVQAGGQISFSKDNGNFFAVSDVDAEHGTETVTLSVDHGTIHLAAGSGVTVTRGADSSATVTFSGTIKQLNAALDGLTYAADAGFAGDDTLNITIDDEGHDGLGGAQKGSTTMVVSIQNNRAPVLDPTPSLTLGTVQEEAWLRPDSGIPVSNLADQPIFNLFPLDNVLDADFDRIGLALTAADPAHGTWFYSIDGGNHWDPVGAVSDSSALVLASDDLGLTRIAFVPAADFNGTITDAITFRAWDMTDGSANGTKGVDASVNGGSSAFSSATDTASITVAAVNDAPVIRIEANPDLVVVNQTGQSVSFLTGDGAGHLAAGAPLPIGAAPASIAAGDVNHDGRLDLVIADPGRNSVSVLLGDGLGGFTAAGSPIPVLNPTSVALLDFNGDGNLDLVAPGPVNAQGERFIDIRSGVSDGQFSAPMAFGVVANPIAMAVGDFDHDGRSDIAIGDGSSNTVTIVGFGGGPQFVPTPVATLSARPNALAVSDLNHDGNLDIVAAIAGGPEVLIADGHGGFAHNVLFAAPDPTDVAVGDVNHDGNLDVVVADRLLNAALVLLGDGQGGFTLSQTLPVGNVPSAIELVDLEGDGDLDIVTANRSSNSVSVLQGFGDGTFTDAVAVSVGRGPVALASGNFDAQTVAVDGLLRFSPLFRNAITLSDVDANGGTETLTLSVRHGTITPSAGLAVVSGGAPGTATVTLTGTIADLNAALSGLRYAPQAGFSGADTLTITVNDSGNGGAGGPLTATQFVAIAVATPNQAPVIDLQNHDPIVVAINTQVALASALGGAITVSDLDANGAAEAVTVSVGHGGVRLTTLGGATITGGSDFSASVSFAGTIAQLNAALAGLAYVPETGYTGDDTLNIAINDGGHTGLGGTLSATASVSIVVSPFNAAPAVHLDAAAQAVSEDAPLVFSAANHNAITVSDSDSQGGTETVTVSADHGNVTLASGSGVTVTGGADGSASVTFSGSLEQLNAALDGLAYTPAQDFNGLDSLIVNIDDGGHSGVGGPVGAQDAVTITVTPENDAPAVALQTTDTQVVGRGTAFVFGPVGGNAINISDVDGNQSIETVTLSVDHGALFIAPHSGVRVIGGADGSADVTFTGTIDQLNTALLGLVYAAEQNFNGPDALSIRVEDRGLTATGSIPIEVVNTAPVLDAGASPVLSPVEDAVPDFGAGTLVSSLVGLADQGGIANVTDPSGPGLGIAVVAVDSSLGTWLYSTDGGSTWHGLDEQSLSSDMLLLAADADTRLFFQPAADFDGTASHAITFRAWDMSDQQVSGTFVPAVTSPDSSGAFSLVADTADVVVFPINDEPVIHVDDVARTVSSDAAFVFSAANNNAITVSDIDAHGGTESVTVAAAHGSVTLASGTGVTVTGGADGSASVTFAGTIAQLNAALDGLTYTPTRNFDGSGSLTITIDDQGNTGFDSALTATKIVPISVVVVNDAPVIDLTILDTPIVERGQIHEFANTAGHNGIVVSDIDANGAAETVRLSVAHGSLMLAANSGVAVSAGADGSSDVTFTGTIEELNAALNGLVYRADVAFNGNTSLDIEIHDESLTTTASIPMVVGNRAPVLDPGARNVTLTVNEDEQPHINTGILIANVVQLPRAVPGFFIPGNFNDADGPGVGLAVTAVDTTHGHWWYSTNLGVQWSAIDPQLAAEDKVVLLNADLRTVLFFQPDPDFNGTVEDGLTFRAWDHNDGNANGAVVTAASLIGTNAISSDVDTMNVVVTAVNDAPTIAVPASIEVTKGTASPLAGIVFADSDAGSAPVHVELSGPADGFLAASSVDGVTVGGTPTLLTLDGSIDAINAFIAGSHLTFTSSASTSETVGLDVSISDGGNSGEGGPLAASQIVPITVKALNDAPVLHPAASLTLAVTEDAQPDAGAGTLVSSLINRTGDDGINNVTDSDGPGRGIAVTAVDSAHGTWLYSTDTGAHWTAIDPDLDGNDQLLLLAADRQTYLFFQPAHDFNGTVADAITFRAWDMSDGAANGTLVADGHVTGGSTPFSNGTETANVTVDAINDAPTITAPSSITVAKHVASPLTGIVFSDDSGSAPVHVALNDAFGGQLEASSGNGVTVGGTSSFLTLDGSIDAINAFIAASHVTYTSPPNGTTSTFLVVTIDDEANAGLGPRSPGSLTANGSVELAIDAVNFTPALTDDGSTAATLEQQPVLLDPSLTVSDLELDAVFGVGDYAGASLTVARQGGADPEDAFGFDTAGASFTVNGNALQSEGLTFATFASAAGGLTIDFTSEETGATTALVNDVLKHVTYVNQSDTPPALVVLDQTFSDGNDGFQGSGGPGLATHSTVVHITPVDDAPQLNAGPLSVNEFAATGTVVGVVSVADFDSIPTAGQPSQGGGQVSYALTDDAGGRFTIDDNGAIHVADGLLLDYEEAAAHDITVHAIEAGNVPVDKTFTVTVNNIDPEHIVGDGNGNTFYGGALDDSLNGAGGDDWLQGRGGNNILAGGDGIDTVDYAVSPQGIYLDFASDHSYRNGFGGMDTVSGIEQVLGSSHDDIVRSGPGDHRIDGGAGIDAVDYAAAPGPVTANLTTGMATNGFGGTDTLVNVEIVLGSSFNDTLIGDAHDNDLFGYFGADIMKGGLGNDIYTVDNIGDQVIEDANAGRDGVHAMISYALPDNVENLRLDGAVSGVGNALDNKIEGDAGNNLIDGGAGIDVMIGGAGNDVYFADDFRDDVVEMPGEGIDAVVASASYALSANVETLVLTGTGDLSGTGNDLANTIFGNAGNNEIDGGLAADVMAGGLGDDTYRVDNAGDRVVEQPGGGHDVVFSSVSFLIENDIEDLHLVGTAGTGVGNAAANLIVGNAGDNTIDGRGGADTMVGGLGNDSYFVDDIRDHVVEAAGEGTDTVYAGISVGLADNVENLIMTGTGSINGVGNSLDNIICGNAGNNALDGGAGADTLTGGPGNDTFIFGAGQANGDVVTDFQGNGGTADLLVFSGYGPGATFIQDDATHWEVNGNGHHDVITLSNAATIHAGDWLFV